MMVGEILRKFTGAAYGTERVQQPEKEGTLVVTIPIRSVQHAVSNGSLIDLATDYRTARTLHACLPAHDARAFAISADAYREHVLSVQPGVRQRRLEAICFMAIKAADHEQDSPATNLPAQPRALEPALAAVPLKVEWYSPNRVWVVLLHTERLQPLPS